MQANFSFPLSLAVASAVLLSACASGRSGELDAGQRISARGEAIAGRGQAWSNAQNDVRDGQKLLEKSTKRAADAQKDLQEARDDIAKAERALQQAQADRVRAEQQVASGNAQMQRAETEYMDIRNRPAATQPQ